jgi:hypothetical protein
MDPPRLVPMKRAVINDGEILPAGKEKKRGDDHRVSRAASDP